MKVCTSCEKEKPEDQFNKRAAAPDGLSYRCRDCSKSGFKRHYQHNKATVIANNRARTQRVREMVHQYKAARCCERCDENDPVCLDFHHPGNKEFSISNGIKNGLGWDRILTEIEQCIILCSNCHRKEHASIHNTAND